MTKKNKTSTGKFDERLKINAPFEDAIKVFLKNDKGAVKEQKLKENKNENKNRRKTI